MDKKLQEQLYNKYPKIFRQKDLSKEKTAMCWGIDTGDGWYNLIDSLCKDIQKECDKTGVQVEACQVKEKFGGLRFYIDFGSDEIFDLIHKAEEESFKICENCGITENVTLNKKGWIQSLCPKCRKQ